MNQIALEEKTSGLLKIISDKDLRFVIAKKINGNWKYYEGKKILIPQTKQGPMSMAIGLKKYYEKNGQKVNIVVY